MHHQANDSHKTLVLLGLVGFTRNIMLTLKDCSKARLTVNDNHREIKVGNIEIDTEIFQNKNPFQKFIKFDYLGSRLKIYIDDYNLQINNFFAFINIKTSEDWEKKIMTFTE